MSEIALYEAKARLSAIVEQVQATGEEVVITRRGKPVARLVAMDDSSALESALAHLLTAREHSQPGSQSLHDLIDEGRA